MRGKGEEERGKWGKGERLKKGERRRKAECASGMGEIHIEGTREERWKEMERKKRYEMLSK